MLCVNRNNPEFKALSKRLNVSKNGLELIIHKYQLETGNEEDYPSDVYIQHNLGKSQYQESSKSVRKLWEIRYSTPKEYSSMEELQTAKEEASKYFPKSAIYSHESANNTFIMTIQEPVTKLSQTKEEFFEEYDGKDTFKNLLRRAYNIKKWAVDTLTDKQLKAEVIKALIEDYNSFSTSENNIQFAIDKPHGSMNNGTSNLIGFNKHVTDYLYNNGLNGTPVIFGTLPDGTKAIVEWSSSKKRFDVTTNTPIAGEKNHNPNSYNYRVRMYSGEELNDKIVDYLLPKDYKEFFISGRYDKLEQQTIDKVNIFGASNELKKWGIILDKNTYLKWVENRGDENNKPLPTADTKINIWASNNENADLSNLANRPFSLIKFTAIGHHKDFFERDKVDPVIQRTSLILERSNLVGVNDANPIQVKSVENLFQALKVLYGEDKYFETVGDNDEFRLSKEGKQLFLKILNANPFEAKHLGGKYGEVKGLTKMWDEDSSIIMKNLIKLSFYSNPQALQRLLDTGNATLTHNNANGKPQDVINGESRFPKLLMEVRDELRKEHPELSKSSQSSTQINPIVSQLINHLTSIGLTVFGKDAMEAYLKDHDIKFTQQAITKDGEEFLLTPQGDVYGFVDGKGNIYLDETAISFDVPIHEYTHLWDRAIAKYNPELWKRGIALMKQAKISEDDSLWDTVLNDDNYGKQWIAQGITGNKLDSLIASEVHSILTGKRGAEELAKLEKNTSKNVIEHLKTWLKDFVKALKDTFAKWTDKDLENLSEEDFLNMTLRDFANGLNPNNHEAIENYINSLPEDDLSKQLKIISQEENDKNSVDKNKEQKEESTLKEEGNTPSEHIEISLPEYNKHYDRNDTITVDAEWKIPELRKLDKKLGIETDSEEIERTIADMDKIFHATSQEKYNQELQESAKKDIEKTLTDFGILNNQYDNLFSEDARECGLTAAEIKHTAELIMDYISDDITRCQTIKDHAQKIFPSLKTDIDLTTVSRRKVVEIVGINNFLKRARTIFSPAYADYNDIDISMQADIINENWDAFIALGAATFELNEGYGLKRNHDKQNYGQSKEREKVDVDNFNGYDNDTDSIAENEGKDEQEHWQIETKTIDNLQSMSQLVRQAIHECYLLDKDGNKIQSKWSTGKDKLELPERVDPRKAMNSIYRWTQGALDLESMVKALSAKQATNPWLSQLINRLSDKSGKETDFQSQFYGVFAKHFQPYSIVLFEDGTYRSISVNDHPALHQVIDNITTLFKVGQHPLFSLNGIITQSGKKLLGTKETTGEDAEFNLHKAATSLKVIADRVKHDKVLNSDSLKEATDDILGVCKIFGFYDIDEKVLDGEITTSNIREISESLNNIVKILDRVVSLQKEGKEKNYNPFDSTKSNAINSALRKFLIPATNKLEDEAITAFYDSGKMYQSYITPSFMTKLMNKFRQEGTAFQDFIRTEYGNSEWYKAPGKFTTGWKIEWLRRLATDENARKVFDHKVELNFNKHNYMRNMSDAEYTLSLITEYFSETLDEKNPVAWFRMPMQSNKPSSEFIKFYCYRDSSYKDSIVSGLHDIFMQELARIDTVRKRNLDKKDPNYIKNFDSNGRRFCFLPILNAYLEDTASAKAKRNVLRNEDTTPSKENEELARLLQQKVKSEEALSPDKEKRLEELVKKVLYQSTEDRVQSILNKWENDGIIKAATQIKGIYPTEAKYGKKLTDEEKLNFTRDNIENFLWNDSFASKMILELTIGDIAFYKDAEDLQKRLAQLHAPGIRGNIQATDYNGNTVSDGKYRTFILKDFDNFRSNLIANISEVFDRKIAAAPKNQRPMLEALKDSLVRPRTYKADGSIDDKGGKYWNINATDAQGYSSPSSYRKKAFIFGKWSKTAEDIYQKLVKGEYNYTDLETAFQPLKPFVYSRISKDMGVENAPIHTMNVPFQAKNAEYLLIMADAILQGEKEPLSRPNLLRAVYRVMEDSAYDGRTYKKDEKGNLAIDNPGKYNGKGIDTVQFESAIKSSLQGTIDITEFQDMEGGEEGAYTKMMESIFKQEKDAMGNRIYNTKTFVHEASFEDYCLQQEVPEHFKNHEQSHGSQIRMITPSDLDYYTNDIDANGEKVINYYEFDDFDINGKKVHKKLTAKEYKQEYENTIAENIHNSLEELSKELHLDGSKKEKNTALSKILIEEIQSNPLRYGVDLIQACSIDAETGEFRIPKGDPIQSKRIEQLINSIIKNRVNKQTIAGGPIVQVSNFGTSKQLHIRFSDKNGGLIPLEEEYNPSEHDNLSYKDYCHKNQGGIAYFEVYAPIWSNDLVKKFGNPDGTIDIKAIEDTDPELLKMVSYRIPTEDKYSCAPMKVVGFMPREAGDAIMLPEELTEIDDSDFDVDKRYVMRKVLHIGIDTKKMASLLKEVAIEGHKKNNNGEISKETRNEINNAVWSFLNNMKESDKPFWGNREKSLYNEYQNIINSGRHDIYRTFPPKEGKAYRDNKIVDMTLAVLTNEMTADKILNPGGFDAPKKMGYMVAAYKNPENTLSWEELSTKSIEELKDLSYIDKDLTFADTQIQFYKQNAAAASLIGVFAVNKVAHATLEGDSILIDISEMCGEAPFKIADFTFDGRMQVDPRADTTGTLLGKTLGSLVSASADAVKDPILNLMNINMTTAGMLNSMLRLGMTFDDAALFISQNVISDVIDEFNRENLSNYQSLDKIIQKRINTLESNLKTDKKNPSTINTEPISKEELIEGLLTKEHDVVDYKVLCAFQKLKNITDAMRKLTFTTRFNSISSAVGPLIIDNLIIEHKMNQFLEDTHFYTPEGEEVNIETIFDKHPILREFSNTVGKAADMFYDMPAGSNGFRGLLQVLPKDISDKMYNDKKLLDKLSMFYQSYLAIASGLINPSQIRSYIEKFPDWFTAKHENEGNKAFKEMYPDNALIQAIDRNIDKKGRHYLSTIITGKDESEKELLRSAWIDLHNDNPELSWMLFNYSFFRGGIGFSPKTFMALIPTYVKERLKNKNSKVSYIETYRNFSEADPEIVIDQFIRNNWNNNKLVPWKDKANHFDYAKLKEGKVRVRTKEDIDDLKGASWMKTSHNGVTYLWHILSEESNGDLIYELKQPLGNNGEYLEISTSNIKTALNKTTQIEDNFIEDGEELKTDSPAETIMQEDSNNNVVPTSEEEITVENIINTIMTIGNENANPTTKNQAETKWNTMKSSPKKWAPFMQTVLDRLGVTVDRVKAEELINKLC